MWCGLRCWWLRGRRRYVLIGWGCRLRVGGLGVVSVIVKGTRNKNVGPCVADVVLFGYAEEQFGASVAGGVCGRGADAEFLRFVGFY